MPKLAIYVPKKDMREIDKWRKKINFSRVFMRALQQEIRERSRLARVSSKDKLAAAAQHYQRELAASSADLADFGHQLGAAHVLDCKLAAGVIQSLLRIADRDELAKEDVASVARAIGEQAAELDRFADQHGYNDGNCPHWQRYVYAGYVQGVASGWRRVCESMKEL